MYASVNYINTHRQDSIPANRYHQLVTKRRRRCPSKIFASLITGDQNILRIINGFSSYTTIQASTHMAEMLPKDIMFVIGQKWQKFDLKKLIWGAAFKGCLYYLGGVKTEFCVFFSTRNCAIHRMYNVHCTCTQHVHIHVHKLYILCCIYVQNVYLVYLWS